MTAVCRRFGHEVSLSQLWSARQLIDAVGDPFPEETYNVCRDADAVLFSAVGDPRFDNRPDLKGSPRAGSFWQMRKKLGLFANIRPVATFASLIHKSPLREDIVSGADFVCIRELTGGMYSEKYESDDHAYDTCAYTRRD